MIMFDSRPLVLVAALVALSAASRADTVVLKPSVRLDPTVREVRLADVAELDGPLALAHAQLLVAQRDDPARLLELTVADVRRALDGAGVHWGKVHLSGRRAIVRPAAANGAAAPRAMATLSLDGARGDASAASARDHVHPAHSAAALLEEMTVRGALVRSLVERLARPAADVRLRFDPQDANVLDIPLAPGLRCELEPLSGIGGPRFQVAVRLWHDGGTVDQHAVGGAIEVRAATVVPVRDIRRGETVRAADLAPSPRWLAPQAADAAATAASAAGRVATTKLSPEHYVRRAQVEAPLVVRRGDQVTARCIVGGLVISMKAEVRGDGAEGDVVECRKLGERETFTAVVAGPGEVVVDSTR